MKTKRTHIITVILTIMLSIHLLADTAMARDVYNSIMKKGYITIGVAVNYPPLNFKSGKKGIEVEMIRELGKFLGVQTKVVPVDVHEFIPALTTGKVDIIIAGMSRNLERARTIWFSVPYLTMTPGVLANRKSLPQTKYGEEFENDPIKTIWDLKRLSGFKLAVKKGSSYEYLLKNDFPEMPTIHVKTNEEALNLLNNGKVDGFVHDSFYLQYFYSNSARVRSKYKLLQGGNRMENICIGLPFGDLILKNQIDVFIMELIRQGSIKKWLQDYNVK